MSHLGLPSLRTKHTYADNSDIIFMWACVNTKWFSLRTFKQICLITNTVKLVQKDRPWSSSKRITRNWECTFLLRMFPCYFARIIPPTGLPNSSPNWRQTTVASSELKWLLHTEPQALFIHTSTLPSTGEELFTSLTSPSVQLLNTVLSGSVGMGWCILRHCRLNNALN